MNPCRFRPACALAILLVLTITGCGNKIDLPKETPAGVIPFTNYTVIAEWDSTQIGEITDITVTKARWLYFAEDSAAIKRYRGNGEIVDGVNVASFIREFSGFERPVKMDEGSGDILWVIDLTEDWPITAPEIVQYDLQDRIVKRRWSDDSWARIDTFWRQPGADSANIIHPLRSVMLTSIAANVDDDVFVSGTSVAYVESLIIQYDTHFVQGGFPGEFDSLTPTGDTVHAFSDTTTEWFVNTYDFQGEFLYEAVGKGTGIGFGVEIWDAAVAENYLAYVDGALDQVKLSDPRLSHQGLDWVTGEEAIVEGEPSLPFDLVPGGVATDPSGFLYVTDSGNGRILKYDPDFRFQRRVDQNDPGVAAIPSVIATTNELVYVYDELEKKVVVFKFFENEEE